MRQWDVCIDSKCCKLSSWLSFLLSDDDFVLEEVRKVSNDDDAVLEGVHKVFDDDDAMLEGVCKVFDNDAVKDGIFS